MKKFLNLKYLLFLSVTLEIILLYLYYFPGSKLLLGDEKRYLDIGLSIAAGGDWHSHPFWPPMQSILIALFSRLFTDPILPLQIFQYGLLLISGFIVRDIVYKETKSRNASQIALAVMILYPSWLAYSQYLWPEVVHVALFTGIIWINNYKNESYKWMVLSGLLLGLAILFKSLLILFVPFLFYTALMKNGNWKKGFPKVVLSLLIAIVTITPASIKSHKMSGSWMVANSSMFNLNLGLKDDKRQHFSHKMAGDYFIEYNKSADTFKKRNQIVKQKALDKIQQQGYITTFINQISKQYFRLFDYQTFFSQQFQGDTNNFVNKYQHRHDSPAAIVLLLYNNVFYFLIVLAMLLGLLVSIKKSLVAQQLALFLLYILGLFLLLHAIPRFRIPMMPIMAFYSGYLYYYLHSQNTEKITFLTTIKSKLVLTLSIVLVLFLLFSANVLDKYYPI